MTVVETELDTFEREDAAYRELLPKLVAEHGEQWVAIHGGEVVDVDPDCFELGKRILRRFGKAFVLIRPIKKDYFSEEAVASRVLDLTRPIGR